MVEKGQIVAGRYRILTSIGAGGMGAVWAAEQLSLGVHVALKLIGHEWRNHPIALRRFQREARACAELASPHIVRILDYDVDPEAGPFMVMELLKGEDLGSRLCRDGVIAPREFGAIGLQIGKALRRAHRAGVIHRDLKPENVFLCEDDDETPLVKLLDFGVAKVQQPAASDDFKTAAGALVGTLARMSPEQMRGEVVDERTDVWGLGLLAFQCIVGHAPIDDRQPPGQIMLNIGIRALPVPSHFNPTVPDGFDEWFARATHTNPDQRTRTAWEAAVRLAEICGVRAPATLRPPAPRWAGDASVAASAPSAPRLAGSPQAAEEDAFFVQRDDGAAGPLTAAQLRHAVASGEFAPDSLVWSASQRGWSVLHQAIAGVAEAAQASAAPRKPPRARRG